MTATRTDPVARRWSLRRWARWAVAYALVVSVVAIGAGTFAIVRLADARDKVVNRVDPAITAALALSTALVNQETGVRGYALSAQDDFLDPYTLGLDQEQDAVATLRDALGDRFPGAARDLDIALAAADRWQTGYALPTVHAVQASGRPLAAGNIDEGKALFDHLRATLTALSDDLDAAHTAARAQLGDSADLMTVTGVVIALALLAGATALASGLTRGVIRPLTGLTAHVRLVAEGDFSHPVAAAGPQELRDVGADVDSMRLRILGELAVSRDAQAVLDVQARELQRSNAELEQFAYVASHDLQEPLRKVASFCELIEARYDDKLDDRGRQYIAFAVDGATRMQALINDLLAFSRVGRVGDAHTTVDVDEVLAGAMANLALAIEETGAVVTADPLPPVRGDAALLTAAFGNLIGNAVKFRHPDRPPHVEFAARPDGDMWRFSCTDNGIGIEADYADRIFVIFQRLHAKSAYPGTGIGLALCRKVIEFHGGRIWLDVDRPPDTVGARFCFTLPAVTAVRGQQAVSDDGAVPDDAPAGDDAAPVNEEVANR